MTGHLLLAYKAAMQDTVSHPRAMAAIDPITLEVIRHG